MNDRTYAMLCHLSGILSVMLLGLGFVIPLVLWLVQREKSSLVDTNGKEAVNFQLNLFIVAVVLYVVIGLVRGLPIEFTFGFAMRAGYHMPVLFLLNVIFSIIAGLEAGKGNTYRYPIIVRLVR